MTDDTDIKNWAPPKIVSINEGVPPPKNEIEQVGESLRRNMAILIENQATVAKLRRAAYLAYVKEGFTAEEALTLCCK